MEITSAFLNFGFNLEIDNEMQIKCIGNIFQQEDGKLIIEPDTVDIDSILYSGRVFNSTNDVKNLLEHYKIFKQIDVNNNIEIYLKNLDYVDDLKIYFQNILKGL